MYEDKTLTCRECGNEFVFSASEQAGQRLGSFWKPFCAKNSCSLAEKTNSLPQSRQVRVLSSYMDQNLLKKCCLPAPLVMNRAPFQTMVMRNNHGGNEPQ